VGRGRVFGSGAERERRRVGAASPASKLWRTCTVTRCGSVLSQENLPAPSLAPAQQEP